MESLPTDARIHATAHLVALLLMERRELRTRRRLDAMRAERDALRAADAAQRAARGEDNVVARFLRDLARQHGTRKPRRPAIDSWLDTALRRRPAATAAELWEAAPDWLRDEIGLDRFRKRVTAARKRRK